MYMTTIGIGSPPIPLRAQVDTSWGPLFVASTDCVSEPCQGDRGHLYNPNNSSTSRGNLGASQVTYPDQFYGVDTWGNETRDTVHVGNLQMDNQLFESVTKWKTFPTGPDRFFDTVIGLALRDIKADDTTMPTTSLFQSMINSRSLDHRLFTLRLSRTDEDPGELVLGGIPDYIDKDELVDIPLTSNYDGGEGRGMRYLASNGGQVALNNITISSGGNSTHQPLLTRGYTAVLSTSYPWIVFPWKETEAIWEQLGFEGGQVPCEARAQLPNITFAFGPDEKKITLTPWDYVLEVYADVYGRLDCTIMIGGMNEFDSNGFVLLGSPFLNGLYSVWDAGNNTMSFANRPR